MDEPQKIEEVAAQLGLERVVAYVPSPEARAVKKKYMAQKKAEQRQRDQESGVVQITLKARAGDAQSLKQAARASLDGLPPTNPTPRPTKRHRAPLWAACLVSSLVGLLVGLLLG